MNPTKLITARSSILTLLTEDEVEINRSIQNPETRHEEANSHKNKQEDIIIAVMGKKGCGKSSFISKLAVKDYTGAVGHDLNSGWSFTLLHKTSYVLVRELIHYSQRKTLHSQDRMQCYETQSTPNQHAGV